MENLQVKHWDLDAQTPDIDNRFRRPGGGRPFKMDQSPPIQYPLTLTSVKECAQDAE
ncbi:hypothetical protein F444_03487, partial [Phytophthora nicotianae P1976]